MTERRFIVVAPDFYPTVGGYAHVVTNFAKWLAAREGFHVTVIAPAALGSAPEIESQGIEIVRVPHRKRSVLYAISRSLNGLVSECLLGLAIRRAIRKSPGAYLWMETFETPIAKVIALFAQKDEILRRSFVRIHGCQETETFAFASAPRYRISFAFARHLARRIPNIASTTRYYIGFFRRHMLDGNEILAAKNYAILHNIVNAPADQGRSAKGAGTIALLALGRMDRFGYLQKNFELIAQALFILKAVRPEIYRRISMTVVGNGSRLADFHGLVAALGVDDCMTMIELLPNSEVRRLQAGADAALLVSRFEGQSAFALESLAAGTPVIVSRGTGIAELIEDGINGFVVDPDDPATLTGALVRLAEADRAGLSDNCVRLFNERYRPEALGPAFDRFIAFAETSRK